jgi:hypothetical protein
MKTFILKFKNHVKRHKFILASYKQLTRLIEVVPIYIFKESGTLKKSINLDSEMKVCFLSKIEDFPTFDNEHTLSSESYLRMQFDKKCTCMALKNRDNQILTYAWCDLKYANFWGNIGRELENNEAYVYGRYTYSPYRGRGFSTFIQIKMIEYMLSKGKDTIISAVSAFNSYSLRTEEKTSAELIYVILGIRFLGKYNHIIPIFRKSGKFDQIKFKRINVVSE